MKPLFLLIALTVSASIYSQENGKTFYFKEVGWTITLPFEYKTLDSIENSKTNNRGLKAIEESTGLTADISDTKTLISATRNTYNYFNSTIRPYNIKTDGNYDSTSKLVKDLVYKTFYDQMPDAKIDSSSTILLLSGISFDKFQVAMELKNGIHMNMILLSKHYNGYDFGISYLYLDEKSKELIEEMLRKSVFD